MTTYYHVRYRCGYGGRNTALIVEDEQHNAYLFSDGALQGKIAGNEAAARLARLLRRRGQWSPLPQVPPYTLDGLRQLTGGAQHAEARDATPVEHATADAAL